MRKKFFQLIGEKDVEKLKHLETIKKQELTIENETSKKYEELFKNVLNNNPLILVEVLSIKSIIFEFHNYHDNFPCLLIRRYSILIVRSSYF